MMPSVMDYLDSMGSKEWKVNNTAAMRIDPTEGHIHRAPCSLQSNWNKESGIINTAEVRGHVGS